MSQTTVTKHYSIRKQNINHAEVIKPLHNIVSKEDKPKTLVKKVEQDVTTSIPKKKTDFSSSLKSTTIDKECKRKQSTLTTFFATESEKLKNDKTEIANEKFYVSQQVSSDPKAEFSFKGAVESEIHGLPRSPKRNLPSPPDEGTPSKRKHLETSEISTVEETKTLEKARRKLQLGSLPSKARTVVNLPNAELGSVSPKQNHLFHTETKCASSKEGKTVNKPKETARRKLQLDSHSSESKTVYSPNTKFVSASPQKSILCIEESVDSKKKAKIIDKPIETDKRKLQFLSKSRIVLHSPSKLVSSSPKKNLLRTPDKLDALIDQSRSKLVLSPKLDELKKALQLFAEKTSSPYKTNNITASPKSIKKKFTGEPFKHLDQSNALALPRKYKVLSEMFRSMDALVGTLNNRKEKITFDNVQEGVQKIMKRNFSEKHLGQIMTVLPSAYILSRGKASYICRKSNSSEYQLVITPNINAVEDEDDKKKSVAFQLMDPSCLISRVNEFNWNLLDLVKKHHQDFLTKINFVPVSVDSIKKWHPKFPIESVPDIPVAQLPESPEMKIYTAKDVLNRFKGSSQTKVGKALQSVADESGKSGVTLELKEISTSKPATSKKELKGICGDLLEKIRAKESAKLLKTMTQSPAETKKLAMLERVPKIVNILFGYFISERKAAIPVDAVVDKIIHSFNSLSTPNQVKEHLKLIAEKFPDWLNFIQIPKGVYITMNKKTNINEMLDNAGLH